MSDKLVVFEKYESPFEANVIKGVLEANGVPAGVLEDGYANTVLRGFSVGAVRLLVREDDVERAREILASEAEATPEADE